VLWWRFGHWHRHSTGVATQPRPIRNTISDTRRGSISRTVSALTTALLTGVVLASCSGNQGATIQVNRAPTTVPVATAGPSAADIAQTVTGPGPVTPNAVVHHISDGDTVVVRFTANNGQPGQTESIRLIGIDTPETKRPNTPVQCFGPEASSFTAALLPDGTQVRVERDVEERDQFGRLLGYIFRAGDGLFINEALARYGYAQQLTYPPNVAYVDRFGAAVGLARDEGRGLWLACPLP
jgi:micrococcal nuclease